MDDKDILDTEKHSETMKFECPNCGNISRDEVIFLCNTCEKDDLIYKDGIYMCPACLTPGENFECMKCGSTKVKMTHVKPKK